MRETEKPIKVWRYSIPRSPPGAEPRDSWSRVFVDEEGFVAIFSDYGHWSHVWPPLGWCTDDLRKELLRMDAGYLRGKLGAQHARIFSAMRTIKAVRERIVQLRATQEIRGDVARRDWKEIGTVYAEFEYKDFLAAFPVRHLRYEGCANYDVHNAVGLDHWVNVSFPRLKMRLREQLDDELKKKGVPPS